MSVPKKIRPKPCVIDTDGGVDDALGLILALRSPKLDVKAITVVMGNTGVEQAAKNVWRILKLLGREDVILAKGAEKPLKWGFEDARSVHGKDGLGELLKFKDAGKLRYGPLPLPKNLPDATATILSLAKEYKSELCLITLGPLTNVAMAFLKNKKAMRAVKDVVIMGGAYEVPGNVTALAEFNFWVDPDAAFYVLQNATKPLLIGLDATHQVPFPYKRIEALTKKSPSNLAQFIADSTAFYHRCYTKKYGFSGFMLHDPLAVGAAIDRRFVKAKPCFVQVEVQGELTRGAVVIDRRSYKKDLFEANANLAFKVNKKAFLAFFEKTLWGL